MGCRWSEVQILSPRPIFPITTRLVRDLFSIRSCCSKSSVREFFGCFSHRPCLRLLICCVVQLQSSESLSLTCRPAAKHVSILHAKLHSPADNLSHSPRGEIIGNCSIVFKFRSALSPVTNTFAPAASADATTVSSSGSRREGAGWSSVTVYPSVRSRFIKPVVIDADWPSLSARMRSSCFSTGSESSRNNGLFSQNRSNFRRGGWV